MNNTLCLHRLCFVYCIILAIESALSLYSVFIGIFAIPHLDLDLLKLTHTTSFVKRNWGSVRRARYNKCVCMCVCVRAYMYIQIHWYIVYNVHTLNGNVCIASHRIYNILTLGWQHCRLCAGTACMRTRKHTIALYVHMAFWQQQLFRVVSILTSCDPFCKNTAILSIFFVFVELKTKKLMSLFRILDFFFVTQTWNGDKIQHSIEMAKIVHKLIPSERTHINVFVRT